MISDGTVTIADLTRRYFGQGPPSDNNRPAALRAIKRFIQAILSADVKHGLTRAQWGGDEELFAADWYIREPIFIITEAADASTSVRVLWLDRPTPGGPERIIQLFPDAGEAYEMLRSFLRHRVLPTILLHGSTSGDGHFNCLRFDEQLFTQWTPGDEDGSAMRGRMDQVLVMLGWYVAPRDTPDIPPPHTVIHYEPASGSTYDPSFVLTDASPPSSPDHPLTPTAHFALLSALNPRRRSRDILAPLWAQAESVNLAAYRTWSEAQPPAREPRSDADTVNAGCRHWSAHIPSLVSLLRALPYPEVALCLIEHDILQHLGNELNELVDNGTVPAFVRAEDQTEGRRQWVRLVALVVVVSDDDLTDLASVVWLRQHPAEAITALHAVRLHDWTMISQLAQLRASPMPTPRLANDLAGDTRL